MRQFRDLGVKVIAADSGTDLTVADDDPIRTLIRQVLGAVSQFEKSIIVLKLRAARNRKRKTEPGWSEGRKPFGHYPGEVPVLKRIKELRRKPRGKKRPSFQATANVLNTEGHTTRTGIPWNRGCVHAICKREGWQ